MNNLLYGNQDPQKIAASIEEKVRKELAAPVPIAVRIEDLNAGPTSVATVLFDVGNALNGGRPNRLFTAVVELPSPCPATLQAIVERQGVGAYVGPLLFAATFSKPVAGEVTIEDHKMFGSPKFVGEPGAAARLNAVKDLAKRVDKLLRTETDMGSIHVKAPRTFKVAPEGGGSTVVLGTLPRMTSMGMSAEVDACEFLAVAAAIEAAL